MLRVAAATRVHLAEVRGTRAKLACSGRALSKPRWLPTCAPVTCRVCRGISARQATTGRASGTVPLLSSRRPPYLAGLRAYQAWTKAMGE